MLERVIVVAGVVWLLSGCNEEPLRTSRVVPPPPVPAIDFGTESVIIASMGTRPTGGYSITIESVQESVGTLYVTVLERSPGSNCVVTQALTAPVHAVRVTGQHASVAFIEKSTTQNC